MKRINFFKWSFFKCVYCDKWGFGLRNDPIARSHSKCVEGYCWNGIEERLSNEECPYSPEMIELGKQVLEENGWPEERLHTLFGINSEVID